MLKRSGETGDYCPFVRKKCLEGQCAMWTHVRGKDPQTGADIDHHGCSLAWLPVLLIENANETRKTSADVQSFRNEVAATVEAFVPGSRPGIERARQLVGKT